jgi:hypothetical protein
MEGASAANIVSTATAKADLSVIGAPVRFGVRFEQEEVVFIVIAS